MLQKILIKFQNGKFYDSHECSPMRITFIKKLLYNLTHNKAIELFVKFDLQLLRFFSDNIFGYSFYIFCLFYGFFGCNHDVNPCNITHSLAAIFVCFLSGLMVQTYILVKIPFTRQYLENLVGKQYIENCLGK